MSASESEPVDCWWTVRDYYEADQPADSVEAFTDDYAGIESVVIHDTDTQGGWVAIDKRHAVRLGDRR